MKILPALNAKNTLGYMALLVIGCVLVAIRNADPLFNPTLYTEDGQWSGMGMSNGWLYAFYYAKDGYLVLGNLLALWLANQSSALFCGTSLICLPESIALISYLFFALVALVAFSSTKKYLRTDMRLLLFLLVIFLPMGNSSNEILGRISNIGYYFVFVALLLLMHRNTQSLTEKFFTDCILIVCMATNPVCIPMVFFYLVTPVLAAPKKTYSALLSRNTLLLLVGFLLISLLVFIKKITAIHPGITGQLNPDNLIEAMIARSILYPFVFPYYESLNNSISIFLFMLWCGLIGWSFTYANTAARHAILAAIATLLLYIAFTLFMRQSLTEQLNHYSVTFPDRYFIGLNVIVIFITVICLNALLESSKKIISLLTISALAFLYAKQSSHLIDYRSPQLPIVMAHPLKEQICLNSGANWLSYSRRVTILTNHPWSMEIPADIVRNSAQRSDCKDIRAHFYLSDTNWTFGVAKIGAAFFVVNSPLTQSLFTEGKTVKLANGELRAIHSTSINGQYLNVNLEGLTLDVTLHGLPNDYAIQP